MTCSQRSDAGVRLSLLSVPWSEVDNNVAGTEAYVDKCSSEGGH